MNLLIADSHGRIFEDTALEATGMKAGRPFRLDPAELIKLPAGSRLFRLPDRRPIGYDANRRDFAAVGDACAVAAFAAPGYTLTYSVSYKETGRVRPLPLFSYGAAVLYKGEPRVAALRVDRDRRHDSTLIDPVQVRRKIGVFRRLFQKNRLIAHLARCATSYGCPNAQNFFLSRYEAPLPVSPLCNASCAGCISYQKGRIHCSQPRIKFAPSADEVAEIALFHIRNAKDPIVSFGQGCEGEPLLRRRLLEESLRKIRKGTARGTINLNTNGSIPDAMSALFDAGLDTVRISLNSAREKYYSGYYRPRGYKFADVVESIRVAKKMGGFVSINYLVMPGFTDCPDEVKALESLISKYKIGMVQWRNLNYDPALYFKLMKVPASETAGHIGIPEEINYLERRFPKLRMGYFNPSRNNF